MSAPAESSSPKFDRYGFKSSPSSDSKSSNDEDATELRREQKWIDMISKWDLYSTVRHSKLHDRIKKGIPDAIRSKAWPLIVDPESSSNPRRPSLQSFISKGPLHCWEVIEADLTRTFPTVQNFSQRTTLESLRRILYGYSCTDQELGYTQGMSFIAAMFLIYIPEEEAFWCFHSLMKSERLDARKLFVQGFPLLLLVNKVWNEALKKEFPKVLSNIEKNQVEHLIYTPSWFLTFFLNLDFPPLLRLNIFERYISFGTRALVSFGLAIVSLHEDILSSCESEDILQILQQPNKSDRMKDVKVVMAEYDKVWLSVSEYKKLTSKAGIEPIP